MSNGNQVKKKGLSPLAWIGIGCGALLVIGGIAMVAGVGFLSFKAKEMVQDIEANPALATAKLIAFADDSLEVVDSSEADQTVTFLKNGEEVVVSFEDIENGNLSWTTSEGTFEVDASGAAEGGTVTINTPDGQSTYGTGSATDLPEWLILAPEAEDLQSSFQTTTNQVSTGAISFKSVDSIDDVKAFYEKELTDAGFEVSMSSYSAGDAAQHMVSGTKNDGQQTMNVVIGRQGADPTTVVIQYQGPSAQ